MIWNQRHGGGGWEREAGGGREWAVKRGEGRAGEEEEEMEVQSEEEEEDLIYIESNMDPV